MLNIAKAFTKSTLYYMHYGNISKRNIVSAHSHRARRYQNGHSKDSKTSKEGEEKAKSKKSYARYFIDKLPDILKVVFTPGTIFSIILLSSLYKGYQENNKSLQDQRDGIESKQPSNWFGEALGIVPPKEKPEIKVVFLNEKYQKYIDDITTATMPGAAEIYIRLKKFDKFLTELNGQQLSKLSTLWIEHKELIDKVIKISQRPVPLKDGVVDVELAEKEKAEIQKLDIQFLDFVKQFKLILTDQQRRKFDNITKAIEVMDFLKSIGTYLSKLSSNSKKHVYVLSFPGDIQASRVMNLREEITAVLLSGRASRGDTVVLRLDSGGGTVTGYGLAAAQLARLKAAGIKLVVCIDQVAASGGYMMASVADEIIISPFAVLGSVGVIATLPNFSERMEREGIAVEDVTAGKYKRTMTPYKKTTDEDRAKTQEDINTIFDQFKLHLKTSRPALDVESIATGETWLGQQALDRNLCDRLGTADDVLIEYMKADACLYSIAYEPRKNKPASIFAEPEEASYDNNNSGTSSTVMGRVIDNFQNRLFESFFVWMQHKIMNELNNSSNNNLVIDAINKSMNNSSINNNTNINNQLSPSSQESSSSLPPMAKFIAIDTNPSSKAK